MFLLEIVHIIIIVDNTLKVRIYSNYSMKIKLKDETIIIPTKGHINDAGYDIYSPIDFEIKGHSMSERINLGVGFEIPEGYCGFITERSSQGKIGISTVGNVIDFGYTGFAHVTLINNNSITYIVNKGDKICQMLLLKVGMEELKVVESFEETERGENSHGSTGK